MVEPDNNSYFQLKLIFCEESKICLKFQWTFVCVTKWKAKMLMNYPKTLYWIVPGYEPKTWLCCPSKWWKNETQTNNNNCPKINRFYFYFKKALDLLVAMKPSFIIRIQRLFSAKHVFNVSLNMRREKKINKIKIRYRNLANFSENFVGILVWCVLYFQLNEIINVR